MIRPPLMPLPPREFFRTDEEYRTARYHHARMEADRQDSIKWEMASLLLIAILMCLTCFVAVPFILFGWRGPLYVLCGIGLLWAATYEIYKRI